MLKTLIKKTFYSVIYRKEWKVKYARSLGVEVGNNVQFMSIPEFDSEPYLIKIGNRVLFASDVRFITHEGGHFVLKGMDSARYGNSFGFGRIVIKDNVYIGTRTTILKGVTIGNNCIVGACSLVNKSLPDNGVYAGVPVRRICSIEEFGEKFLANMPEYDKMNYKLNKKEEILKIVDQFKPKKECY